MRCPCVLLVLCLGALGAEVPGAGPVAVADAQEPAGNDASGDAWAAVPVDLGGVTITLADLEETKEKDVHRHDVVIDLGKTPARRVRVEVELSGARRASRFARQVAVSAMSIAASYASPTTAKAVTPLVATMSSRITAPGDAVFVVKGSRLDSLGGGVHVLRFRCLHLAPLESKARITVRALDRHGALLWRLRTPWQPLSRERPPTKE